MKAVKTQTKKDESPMILPLVTNLDLASFIINGKNKGNILTTANGNALPWCMSPGNGKIIIVDIFPQRIEAIQSCLQEVSETTNFQDWSNRLKIQFPSGHDTLKSFITSDGFHNLVNRIRKGNIHFFLSDLSRSQAYQSILNLLRTNDFNDSIDLLDMSNAEVDMRNHLTALDFLPEDQNRHMEIFKENLLALMGDDSKIIPDADVIRFLSKSELSQRDMKKKSDINQTINAEKDLEEINDFSINLFKEINRLIDDGVINSDCLPIITKVQKSTNASKWRAGFINKNAPYMKIVNRAIDLFNRLLIPEVHEIHTVLSEKASILENHLNNKNNNDNNNIRKSFFSIQILSYVGSLVSFIKKGYPNISNFDNKTLAELIEAQFYTELAQFLEAPVEEVLQYKVIQVKGFTNFFRGNSVFARIGMSSTMIIGLGLDAYSLSVDIYKYLQLKESDRLIRSALIASITLSSISLALSGASFSIWTLNVIGYISSHASRSITMMFGLAGVAIFFISTIIFEHYENEISKENRKKADDLIKMLESFFSDLKEKIKDTSYYEYNPSYKIYMPKSNLPVTEVKLKEKQILCTMGDVLYRSETSLTRIFREGSRPGKGFEMKTFNQSAWGNLIEIFNGEKKATSYGSNQTKALVLPINIKSNYTFSYYAHEDEKFEERIDKFSESKGILRDISDADGAKYGYNDRRFCNIYCKKKPYNGRIGKHTEINIFYRINRVDVKSEVKDTKVSIEEGSEGWGLLFPWFGKIDPSQIPEKERKKDPQ